MTIEKFPSDGSSSEAIEFSQLWKELNDYWNEEKMRLINEQGGDTFYSENLSLRIDYVLLKIFVERQYKTDKATYCFS